ncbi:MAG: arylsulfatase [Planctomycetota bacterium]|jgi:arylsulfatase A-like enzyme
MRLLPCCLVLAGCGVATTPGNTPEKPNQQPSRPPSIVYILADDLGYGELGCYGQRKIRTPHVDALARNGMRFTRHYCGAPVCAPSRCVLLTGKHLGHATIRANKPVRPEGQWPIRTDDVTVAEVLRQRGYATACVGKWGLGPVGSTGDPNRHGFDLFYGYICQRVAHSYYPPHLWHNGKRVEINKAPVPGHHRPGPDEEIDFDRYHGEQYAPGLMLRAAVEFIQVNKDRPFFLYFAPVEPHVAMHPPRDHVDRYPQAWDTEPYRGQRGYLPHPRPRAGYAAMISDLDRQVGKIVHTIEALGLTANTLILFSSDNGPTHDVGGVDTRFFDSSGGLRGRKGSVYEGGVRVPMIASWPGTIPNGTTTDHVSAFQDVFPTLCDLAGAETPAGLDGKSFLPTLRARGRQEIHPYLLWEFHGYRGQQAVIFKQGRWKAIRRNLRRGNRGFELYDLAADPQERHDLAAGHPELVQQAAAILAREHTPNPDFPLPALDVDDNR